MVILTVAVKTMSDIEKSYFNAQRGPLPRIGLRPDLFSASQAMACALLTETPDYKNADLVRSDNAKTLESCTAFVGMDDRTRAENGLFGDRSPNKFYAEAATPMSAAGLVYAHVGRRFIAVEMYRDEQDELVEAVYQRVYRMLIEHIDAHFHQIEPFDGKPRYQIASTLAERIRRMNTRGESESNRRFEVAVELCRREFKEIVHFCIDNRMA